MAEWERRTQGDDKELVQSSVWQHLQNMSQPHILLQASVSFLRHLHGLPQLSFELWPLVHFLPPPHPSAARGSSVDGPALHRLHEDTSPGGDVSHTLRAVLSQWQLGFYTLHMKKNVRGLLSYSRISLQRKRCRTTHHTGQSLFYTVIHFPNEITRGCCRFSCCPESAPFSSPCWASGLILSICSLNQSDMEMLNNTELSMHNKNK